MENTVNDVQSEVVVGQETPVSAGVSAVVGGEEKTNAAESQREKQDTADAALTEMSESAAAGQQSREENRNFRKLRQELERLQKENADLKNAGEKSGQTSSVSQRSVRRYLDAFCDRVTAQTRQARMEAELRLAKTRLADELDRRELEEVRSAYPQVRAQTLSELGETYQALRRAGVDHLTAYGAVLAGENARRSPIPVDTGAVGSAGQQEKEYYSPEEVDRLSSRDLDDPKIMERVLRSMTKWKRR